MFSVSKGQDIQHKKASKDFCFFFSFFFFLCLCHVNIPEIDYHGVMASDRMGL